MALLKRLSSSASGLLGGCLGPPVRIGRSGLVNRPLAGQRLLAEPCAELLAYDAANMEGEAPGSATE